MFNVIVFVSGLNGSGRTGDLSGYMSDGDLVRSRIQGHHGPPGHGIYGGYTSDTNYGGYTSDNTYNDPGYGSDNHYNRCNSLNINWSRPLCFQTSSEDGV